MDTVLPPQLIGLLVPAFSRTPQTPFVARARASLVAVLCGAALFSAELPSQSPLSVTGTVTTGDSTPVANARIRIVGTEFVAETHLDGRFRVSGVPVGRHVLDVRLLGYRQVLQPFEVESGKTIDVQVRLAADNSELEPVVVTAKSLPPELVGFEERRSRGAGRFFTREEIARIQPVLFTDVLRRVPGMQFQPVTGPFGTGYSVGMGRDGGPASARSCPVLFYVNGVPFPVTPDVPINHFIVPEEIAAIEVYTGMSRVPPQFTSSAYNIRCGVVVIWTYTGERRHGSSKR